MSLCPHCGELDGSTALHLAACNREAALQDEVTHLRAALVELYEFVVNELDPDPEPIEDYITDADAQRAAQRAWEVAS